MRNNGVMHVSFAAGKIMVLPGLVIGDKPFKDILINTYTMYTRKNAQVVTSLQTSCNKSVHKLSTSCVRTACS